MLNIIQILPISSARLIFSTSCLAVALGASAGSRETTSCPMEGQLIFMKINPKRLATYSIKVVLP